MATLTDRLESLDDGHAADICALRIRKEPSMIILFTQEIETVNLHYEEDEAIRSYVQCPGSGCPLCHIGSKPAQFDLLPVYSIDSGNVEVLRISSRRGPGSLLTALAPFLKDPNISNKLFLVSRSGMQYRVECRDLGEKADRGEIEIQAFLKQLENGLELRNAFPFYPPADLAEIERVRKKLNAMGGYSLPNAAAKSDEDSANEEEE